MGAYQRDGRDLSRRLAPLPSFPAEQKRMKVSREEIEAKKTVKGSWTRKTLESWGIIWPPRKGWKYKLMNGLDPNSFTDEYDRTSAEEFLAPHLRVLQDRPTFELTPPPKFEIRAEVVYSDTGKFTKGCFPKVSPPRNDDTPPWD